jgi:hypothetical protein
MCVPGLVLAPEWPPNGMPSGRTAAIEVCSGCHLAEQEPEAETVGAVGEKI